MRRVFSSDALLRPATPRRPMHGGLMLVIAALTIGGGIVAIFNLSLVLRSLFG